MTGATSAVDEILTDCSLTRWLGDPKRCRWCNAALRFPRRVWCTDGCQAVFRDNHVWKYAQRAARARERGFRDANGGTCAGLLETHHLEPCVGVRTASCLHHQENLVVVCGAHHLARHRVRA